MSARRRTLPMLALIAALAGAAHAQTLNVSVPAVTAAPGATVDVPIAVSPGPDGLGILGIQLRLDLGAAVVQSASFLTSSGWLWWWGAPAQNANAAFAAAAAAGVTPVGTGGATLATVRIVVRPDAVLGTDLPLTLSTMAFNEGTPAAVVSNGLLRVRSGGLDAPDAGATALAFAAPVPNPARGSVRLAFTLARPAVRARLAVFAPDGRLVRRLADGARGAGRHELAWDLHDAAGRSVAPGLYFAWLDADETRGIQRFVVIR